MRILHLVHQYPPDYIGGTELYTRSVAQALAHRGHEVGVFYRHSADGEGMTRRVEGDVRVWAVWAGPLNPSRRFLSTFGGRRVARAFQQALDEVQPDLLHLQHLMGLPVSLLDLVWQRRIPIVLTLHDYWWVCANAQLLTNYDGQVCHGPRAYLNCARCALVRAGHPGLWPAVPAAALLLLGRNRVLRRALERVGRFVVPTAFVGRWYAGRGIPPEHISMIPHGVERPALARRQGEKAAPPVRLVYVGGLSWQKGIHVAMQAFRDLGGAGELWIVGDESFDPAYMSHLRALASPGVRFLGKLGREEVWGVLAQADAVVVPSLWYETFSLLAHEAFAAGVPVIASDLGALAEAVRDGVDGLLVPPGDVAAWRAALQRLTSEPHLLTHLRANVGPPMTLEEHVDRLESLYTQLVDRRLRA